MEDDDFFGAIPSLTTVDMSMLSSTYPYTSGISPLTTAQISALSTSSWFSAGSALGSSGPYNFSNSSSLHGFNATSIKSNLVVDGDITWNGHSLGKLLETIESRLAILDPKPEKVEKFAALKKAYDHYKLLETLINDDDNEEQQ